jgi:hypothetical protein
MWAFFSARLRLWLILAIGAPVVGWLLGKIGDVVERRRGPNTLSRVLQRGRGWLRRRSRGPLAPRQEADSERPLPHGSEDAGTPAR